MNTQNPGLFLFVILMMRVVWRHVSGRWYIFRDMPQWFVEEMADVDSENPRCVDSESIAGEARAELRRRERRAS